MVRGDGFARKRRVGLVGCGARQSGTDFAPLSPRRVQDSSSGVLLNWFADSLCSSALRSFEPIVPKLRFGEGGWVRGPVCSGKGGGVPVSLGSR